METIDNKVKYYFGAIKHRSYMCTNVETYAVVISESPVDFIQRCKSCAGPDELNTIGPFIPISKEVYDSLKQDAITYKINYPGRISIVSNGLKLYFLPFIERDKVQFSYSF